MSSSFQPSSALLFVAGVQPANVNVSAATSSNQHAAHLQIIRDFEEVEQL
jgi:hypothetical protein